MQTDEEGSTAAAATQVEMIYKTLTIQLNPINFEADHPFFFTIVDCDGHQLFAGTYSA